MAFGRHCGATHPHPAHDYFKEWPKTVQNGEPMQLFTCPGTEWVFPYPEDAGTSIPEYWASKAAESEPTPVETGRYRVEAKDWAKWEGNEPPVIVLARLEYIADAVAVRSLHANSGAYIVDTQSGYTLS